ncbi:MAG TPA: hypothetical protein VK002_11090 [Rubricoccaceae bacterium]|nr:hypothetical protein [Rubricoccaceae bacterium]
MSETYRSASHLALQPDGKIVVAGSQLGLPDGTSSHLVGRHLPDGALDTAFGDGGYAVYDFAEGQFDAAAAVAVLPDGRIVIGGGIEFAEYASTFARYLGDAPVAVSAAPAAPPAVIPPAGGAFPFTIHLANATDEPLAVQVWTEAGGPAPRSPVLGPRVARLAPGEVLTRTITQHVPARAGR